MNNETTTSLDGLLQGDLHPITNLANAAALLWQEMDRINWLGFYLLHEGMLCLGPFQGKPACTQIAIGKGVCGTAFQEDRMLVVPDVHAFPGHITCDAASRSEIVIPLHHQGRCIGVLDIDSPEENRFTQADVQWLLEAAQLLEEACHFAETAYNLQTHE